MKYKNILFDADGTLLDFERAEAVALSETLIHFSLPDTEENRRQYSAANLEQWALLEQKAVTRAQLKLNRFANFCARIGATRNAADMAEFYEEALSKKNFLIEGVLETCQILAQHCDLYIITNGFIRIQNGRFSNSPITPLMKRLFISEEIGVEKPDVGFFDWVAREIPDFDKRTALVVGDRIQSDIEGGIGAGIDTCWYNPARTPSPVGLPITYTITELSQLQDIIIRGESRA